MVGVVREMARMRLRSMRPLFCERYTVASVDTGANFVTLAYLPCYEVYKGTDQTVNAAPMMRPVRGNIRISLHVASVGLPVLLFRFADLVPLGSSHYSG